MTPPFEFVITDPATNLKPGKSLQIRSRCMQGKNKRDGSRRSEREKKRAAREEAAAGCLIQEPTAFRYPLPRSPIGDLALIRFADPNVDNEAKGMVLKMFTYNIVNEVMSPLEHWVDFGSLEPVPFEWMFSDRAVFHTTVCASYAINDVADPGGNVTPGHKTAYHLQETLALLQTKLGNQHSYLDETVLHVVIELALLAAMFGDWPASAVHYKGLRRIIKLRGDLDFLRARPKLHFKLDRIDLAYTLSSGKTPFFLDPNVLWDSIIPATHLPLPPGLYRPPPTWDVRFRTVFQDLQYLSLKLNYDITTQARCSAPFFQSVLTSLQSRLVLLADAVANPVEELIRLALLACLTTTFKHAGHKIPYAWAIGHLRATYAAAECELFDQDESFCIWVVIIIACTITSAQEEWVKKAWARIGAGLDWTSVKVHLKRIMWIDAIHDRPGEMVYQELERSMLGNELVRS